jgi:hypothetical protein
MCNCEPVAAWLFRLTTADVTNAAIDAAAAAGAAASAGTSESCTAWPAARSGLTKVFKGVVIII